MDFERYPMWMKHPHHRPAVVSDDYEAGANRGAQFKHHAKPGVPEQFPAVMVNNPDQEGYYAAKGYVAQGGDPKAFERAQIAPIPQGYRHQEYPRIVNGLVQQDPNAPEPETNEYPKWVRPDGQEPRIVKSRAEENEIMRGSTKHEPVKRETSPVEADCLAAIMAAAERPILTDEWSSAEIALMDTVEGEQQKLDTSSPHVRKHLLRLKASALGIECDKRWGEKKL